MTALRFHPIVVADGPVHLMPMFASTVRCGSCRRWLHVDEDELLASFEHPLRCWSCDDAQAGSAP